jgi:hypothetical protein
MLEYAGNLMQHSLLELARAADDLVVVFGVSRRQPLLMPSPATRPPPLPPARRHSTAQLPPPRATHAHTRAPATHPPPTQVGSKDVAALYTVWAVREARAAAVQLRKNALTALAASATGLVPSMQVSAPPPGLSLRLPYRCVSPCRHTSC